MKVKTDILLRVRIAYLAVALFTIAAVYRLVIIQYVEAEKWIGLGQNNGLKVMKINATRGNIYADDGSLLATSLPFYKVAFDPSLAAQDLFDSRIDSLSYLLSQYFKNLSQRINYLKYAIGAASLGFLFNMMTVLGLYLEKIIISRLIFASCCISMIISILLFLLEIFLSTHALKLHLSDMKIDEK